MNLFDFDKTIYRKDSSIKFYFFCFWRSPKMFFHLFYVCFWAVLHFFHAISTKAFKEKFFSFLKYFDNVDELVSKFWEKQGKYINGWYEEIKSSSDVICSASPQFLVEPIMRQINEPAKVVCTQMDMASGKISGENLKGEAKKERLIQLGYTTFDNVYTDSMTDFPIMDLCQGGGCKYLICGKKIYEFGKQKPTLSVKIKYIIKQLRVKHYIKNLLVFVPLAFAGLIGNQQVILKALGAFVSLCFMASFVYIINDLVDAKKDRNHLKKRKRPIACYMVKTHEAIILAVILFGASLAINIFAFEFNLLSLILLLGYAVINFLYSFWLKNIPILDAFLLAFCFLLRLYFGAVIADVEVSRWLYLTVLCGSLFMGFGKRRNELRQESSETRTVNKFYGSEFLDKVIYICLALCLAFYSLWAVNFTVVGDLYLNSKILMFTIPLVYFIMIRYLYDIDKSTSSGDPTDVFFKDIILILCVLVFVACAFVAVYVPINNFLI